MYNVILRTVLYDRDFPEIEGSLLCTTLFYVLYHYKDLVTSIPSDPPL